MEFIYRYGHICSGPRVSVYVEELRHIYWVSWMRMKDTGP